MTKYIYCGPIYTKFGDLFKSKEEIVTFAESEGKARSNINYHVNKMFGTVIGNLKIDKKVKLSVVTSDK